MTDKTASNTTVPDKQVLEALVQRNDLFVRLSRIQRSISHRAPLNEVLDAITAGASELLGDQIVSLRLIDEDDPSSTLLVSGYGVPDRLRESLLRSPIGQGVGGLAILEARLVVENDYARAAHGHRQLIADGLKSAMAAPVREGGVVVGSLVVASYKSGREFSESEQEALLAFAQHAGLALSDAKAVEALRDAQRSKEMFFAMVSHELKTPLTAIMGLLLTLKKHSSSLTDELRDELIDNSYERAQDLRRLIDHLLAGAKAELASRQEEAFLPGLVAEAAKGFDHSRALVIRNIPELTLRIDTIALREVVGILLENALSHSPDQTAITIDGRVGPASIEVSVTNEGALPEGLDHADLFAAFQRGSAVGSATGVGLGLYIAARLAESMKAHLRAISSEGRVTFFLVLPIHVAPVDSQSVTAL
jgi:K+-sensing histidine kinase KdpD